MSNDIEGESVCATSVNGRGVAGYMGDGAMHNDVDIAVETGRLVAVALIDNEVATRVVGALASR